MNGLLRWFTLNILQKHLLQFYTVVKPRAAYDHNNYEFYVGTRTNDTAN